MNKLIIKSLFKYLTVSNKGSYFYVKQRILYIFFFIFTDSKTNVLNIIEITVFSLFNSAFSNRA